MDLIELIKLGSTNKVEEIIKSKGVPIDDRWLDYTVLNVALQHERKTIAKLLLERGCRVNKSSQLEEAGNTPLHHAILLGDVELVHRLLQKKASVVAADSTGNTALHLAFLREQIEIIDLLLTALKGTSNYTNVKNNLGLTHLHIVCTRKNKEVIAKFLEKRSDIEDSVSNESALWSGYTALHFAASFKSSIAIELLLKNGASRNPRDASGRTPLQLANEKLVETAAVVDALSTTWEKYECSYDSMSYFHTSCLKNDPSVVKNFIENGARVDAINKAYFHNECTALHFAVLSNNVEMVKLLLEQGATVCSLNDERMTPLHLAFYQENPDNKSKIVDLLYKAVQDEGQEFEDMEDEYHMGFFHVAITRNKIRLVKEFLEDSEDVNRPVLDTAPKFSGYAPLHFAVRYRLQKMAEFLITQGADVNFVCDDGTPLHIAFVLGHECLINLLLKKGADATIVRPKDKKTVLHLLIESYIYDKKTPNNETTKGKTLLGYIEKLVKLGVDVNALSYEWRDRGKRTTAFHFAYQHIQFGGPCVKLLLEFGADINVRDCLDYLPLALYALNNPANNPKDFMFIYHHVQNLKVLGLLVDDDNDRWCQELMKRKNQWDSNVEELKDETLAHLEKQRMDEITKMKRVKLNENMSLFDFLVSKKSLDFGDKEILAFKKVIAAPNFSKLYTSFGYLIRLRLEEICRSKISK